MMAAFRHPALAMPRQIVHHLAAAGGMADVNGVLQIEMRRQRRKVVRIVIHVVAVAGLAGAAVAAAVMGDDAIAVIEEEQHLRVPVVGRERPAMAEHDRLTGAPILVIDLDAVLGLDGRHGAVSSGQSEPLRDPQRARPTQSEFALIRRPESGVSRQRPKSSHRADDHEDEEHQHDALDDARRAARSAARSAPAHAARAPSGSSGSPARTR